MIKTNLLQIVTIIKMSEKSSKPLGQYDYKSY